MHAPYKVKPSYPCLQSEPFVPKTLVSSWTTSSLHFYDVPHFTQNGWKWVYATSDYKTLEIRLEE